MTGPDLRPPAVHMIHSGVLLQGPALLDVSYLMALGIRQVNRSDGYATPARLSDLARLIKAAADEYRQGLGGHGDVPDAADPASFDPVEGIGTREAADILNISPRHVRRLADQCGVRRGRRRELIFDRGAVEGLAVSRANQLHPDK